MDNLVSVAQVQEEIVKNLSQQNAVAPANFQDMHTAIIQNLHANTEAIQLFQESFEKHAIESSQETLTQKAFNVAKNVRDSLEELQVYVDKFSKEKNPTTAVLFEMQYKVMQMSILMDISSKVGDKASQAFQTLFRNQG